MNRLDDSGYYDGSRVFSFMVEPLGLSVDQVKTIISGLVYYNLIYFPFFPFFRSTSFWASLLLLLQHLLSVTICTIQKSLQRLVMVQLYYLDWLWLFSALEGIIYWFNEKFYIVCLSSTIFFLCEKIGKHCTLLCFQVFPTPYWWQPVPRSLTSKFVDYTFSSYLN